MSDLPPELSPPPQPFPWGAPGQGPPWLAFLALFQSMTQALQAVTQTVQGLIPAPVPGTLGPAVTVTGTGTYTATQLAFYFINRSTNGTLAFHLPPPVEAGQLVGIKDIRGDASTYPITISDPLGNLIDGSASIVINTNRGVVLLIWDGGNWARIL